MKMKNALKLLLLVITLWLVSVTFQHTFAEILNFNRDLVEHGLDDLYEENFAIDDEGESDESEIDYDTTEDDMLIEDDETDGIIENYSTSSIIITFDMNGGTGGPENQIREAGVEVELPEEMPILANQVFQGWATTSDGTVDHDAGVSTTFTENQTLFAVWGNNARSSSFFPNAPTGPAIGCPESIQWTDSTGVIWCVLDTRTFNGNEYSFMMTRNVVQHSMRYHHQNIIIQFENAEIRNAVNNWFNNNASNELKQMAVNYEFQNNSGQTTPRDTLGSGVETAGGAYAQNFDGACTRENAHTNCNLENGIGRRAISRPVTNSVPGRGEAFLPSVTEINTFLGTSNDHRMDGTSIDGTGVEGVGLQWFTRSLGPATNSSPQLVCHTGAIAGCNDQPWVAGAWRGMRPALWVRTPSRAITVTFNGNGHTGGIVPTAQSRMSNVASNLPIEVPTRTDHTFLGWSTSQNGNVVYSAGEHVSFTQDTNLWAVWQIACDVIVSTEQELRNASTNSEHCTLMTIRLNGDITNLNLDSTITIDGNREVFLTSSGNNSYTLLRTTGDQRHFMLSGGVHLTIENIILDGGLNESSATYGGGISVTGNDSRFVMNGNSIIRNNRAVNGGAIHVVTNANLTLNNGIISNNHVTGDGGAIWTENNHGGNNPLQAGAYGNITVGLGIIFSGNTAGGGTFLPPADLEYVANRILTTSASVHGHPLNNRDINFNVLERPVFEIPTNIHEIFQDPETGLLWRVLVPDDGAGNALIITEHVHMSADPDHIAHFSFLNTDSDTNYHTDIGFTYFQDTQARQNIIKWFNYEGPNAVVGPTIRANALDYEFENGPRDPVVVGRGIENDRLPGSNNNEAVGSNNNGAVPSNTNLDRALTRPLAYGRGVPEPFVLSTSEANRFFTGSTGADGRQTQVANMSNLASPNGNGINAHWWVRSPGASSHHLDGRHPFVNESGNLGLVTHAHLTLNTIRGVRPALWVRQALLQPLPLPCDVTVTTEAQLRDNITYSTHCEEKIIRLSENINSLDLTDTITIDGTDRRIILTSDSTKQRTLTRSSGNQRHFTISDGAHLTIENIILDGGFNANSAIYGGGISIIGDDSRFIMNDDSVIRNNRQEKGGAIHVSTTTVNALTLNNGMIENNYATYDGGGIFTVAHENLTIAQAFRFSRNIAGNGAFRPSINLEYPDISTRSSSIFNHPLNNFDINFTSDNPIFVLIEVESNRKTTVTNLLQDVSYVITGANLNDIGNIYITLKPNLNPEQIIIELPDDPDWDYEILEEAEKVTVVIAPEGFGVNFEFIKTDESIYDLTLDVNDKEQVVRLNGAVFILERYTATNNWEEVRRVISGYKEEVGNGLVQFEGVLPGVEYRLREIAAPTGFRLPEGHWYIKMNEDGTVDNIRAYGSWVLAFRYENDRWFVGNMREIELPEAGRMGAGNLIIIGVLSLSLVILLYIKQRIKEDLEID